MSEKRFELKLNVNSIGLPEGKILTDNLTGEKGFSLEEFLSIANKLNDENNELKEERKGFESCSHNWGLLYDEAKNKVEELSKENQKLKKRVVREETDKKRLMSYLMRYKGFAFDEIVEDFLDNLYYDKWWEDGFYEFCWDEYLEEKGFDGCDEK